MTIGSAALRRVLEDLIHWLPSKSHEQKGDDLIIRIDDEEIIISEDADAERVIVWCELSVVHQGDDSAAIEAGVRYTETSFDERGATVGVSPDGAALIVGTSVQVEGLDAAMLKNLLCAISDEAKSARAAISRDVAEVRAADRAREQEGMAETVIFRV